MPRAGKKSGAAAFDEYYYSLFGGRWNDLKASLLLEKTLVPFGNKLLQPYFLDEASILAAKLLDVKNAKSILDLCAAPGGKSLVLAAEMPPDARLFCNERSSERKFRLDRVLAEHLPPDVLARIETKCSDGTLWFRRNSCAHDRILLDAPCSSERHVLQSDFHLSQWTAARIKNLSFLQHSLLSSAFLSLQVGGVLVYSTCALSPEENDNAVLRLLSRRGDARVVKILDSEVPFQFERSDCGIRILPDLSAGRGPLYIAKLEKSELCGAD